MVVFDLGETRISRTQPIPDYQLYLAPGIIRQQRPAVIMQQFIHIPLPEVRYWLLLPSTIVQAIDHGLAGNDIVGFQTGRDVRIPGL